MERKKKVGKQKEAIILFADIIACSAVSDNYNIEDYNKFLNHFHEAVIKLKMKLIPKSDGWGPEDIEFYVRGDETCLILHSENKINDIEKALLFAILLNFFWLTNKENQDRIKAGKLPREIGVGINKGLLWFDEHLIDEGENEEFLRKRTSEGYAINLAKRVEGASRNGRKSKIFVSETVKCTAEKLPLSLKYLKKFKKGKISFFLKFDDGKRYDDLKGISNPPYLYEIIDFDLAVDNEIIQDLLTPGFPVNKYIEMAETNPHSFWLNKAKPILKLKTMNNMR